MDKSTEGVTVTLDGAAYERLRLILEVMDGSPDKATHTERDVVHFALIVANIVLQMNGMRKVISAARYHLDKDKQR